MLASDTAPVWEVVRHGEAGLLTDFFDADALATARVLDALGDYRHAAGTALIREHYSVDVCPPRMLRLYQDACQLNAPGAPPSGAPADR